MMMLPLRMEQTQTPHVTAGRRARPPRTVLEICPSQTAAGERPRMTAILNSNGQHHLVIKT